MGEGSRFHTGWRVLVGCLVCQMGLGLGAYIFAVFLKPVVAELGWSRTTFSLSTLPLLVAMSLGSPLVGQLTERLGPRFVFTAAISLVALSLGLFSVMQSLWQFYAIGFLLGIAVTGLGDIPAGAVVSQWFERNRGLALGLVYVGSNVGGAIVPIVATTIAAESSWRTALQLLAAGGWLVIVPFALFVVRERRPGEPLPERAAHRVAAPQEPAPENGSLTLGEAVRTPSFWLLCLVLFLFYFYYIGVNNHLVAYLSDSGFSEAEAARRFGAAVAVGILGKIGTGLLADRIPKRGATIVVFALMTAGSFLLLALGRAPNLLPVFLVIHGLTVAAENVVLPLVVADCFGARHLARIYGAIMLMLLPGGVLGPVFAGYAFDTLGSYEPAFTTFAVLNLVSVAALLGVRRERGVSAASAAAGEKWPA